MEAILVDVFRVTVLSDSDARARAIGSRCVIFSFKVGELLGLVCFMIILAPVYDYPCGHDRHASVI